MEIIEHFLLRKFLRQSNGTTGTWVFGGLYCSSSLSNYRHWLTLHQLRRPAMLLKSLLMLSRSYIE